LLGCEIVVLCVEEDDLVVYGGVHDCWFRGDMWSSR
jgi:hypothetical protein